MVPLFVNIIIVALFCLQMRWLVIGGFWGGVRMLTWYIYKKLTPWLDE